MYSSTALVCNSERSIIEVLLRLLSFHSSNILLYAVTYKYVSYILNFFVDFVKPNADKKVLLVLDGHSTHVKNLKAIELARKENVIMLCLPPHTTHKIQPLARTLFKPLQTYYNQAAERWLRTHVGRVITPYELCGLFNEAYCKAATMSTAINGFARCGIWPCSRDVFAESEFHASFSNTRDQSTSFAEAPSTGTTSHHTTAPTAGTHIPHTTGPTAGASTHQSTAPTAGVPTHQTTAPIAGAPTRQSTALTAGAPTHQSTAPTAEEVTHQSVAPTAGAPTHQSAAPTAGASSEQCAFESIGTPSQPASTPTQATDQHYTKAPLSETIDLSPSEGRSVYSTKPDGRYFFRSVVVALEPTPHVDLRQMIPPQPHPNATRNVQSRCLAQ